jgi:hypothetical protein
MNTTPTILRKAIENVREARTRPLPDSITLET